MLKSAPEFAIDLFEGLFHALLDLPTLSAKVLELAEVFRPGFFLRRYSQLLLDSLCDELAQRDAALGGHRLCPAEKKIRNLKGRLHWPILPYLWEMLQRSVARVDGLRPLLARYARNGAPGLWKLRPVDCVSA